MALMCAVSALFMFVQIPLIPAAPFLTYDPSLVPAMVSGFAYGPGSGIAVGVLAVIIHALTTGDWVGALMNIVACVCFILPAALVYQRKPHLRGRHCRPGIGRRGGNPRFHRFEPHHRRVVLVRFGRCHHAAHDSGVIPFNLAKTVLNSVLTLVVYKAISKPHHATEKTRSRAAHDRDRPSSLHL